jgi:hypothetical protein
MIPAGEASLAAQGSNAMDPDRRGVAPDAGLAQAEREITSWRTSHARAEKEDERLDDDALRLRLDRRPAREVRGDASRSATIDQSERIGPGP